MRGPWRRGWESNPRIEVLQTSALPLGYRAVRGCFDTTCTPVSQPIKRALRIRTSVLCALITMLFLHAGCASERKSYSSARKQESPASSPEEPKRSTYTPALPTVAPFAIRRIPLMNSPLDIRRDYVYPPYYMRQKLSWSDKKGTWFMTFPSRRYAYAGFEFKRLVDLSDRPELTRLSFSIRPAKLAQFLSVALLDMPTNQSVRAITDYWLKDAGTFEGEDWAKIEVTLTNFPSEALPVVEEANDDPDILASPRRLFDWTAVREIRFVSGGGRIPNQEIQIRDLCFQR